MNNAGAKITLLTGTMYVAILFCVLSLISLPAVIATGSVVLIIQWITQSFLQLVLLPIIIVGQNVQGAKTEQRDNETHDAVMAAHADTQQILSDLTNRLREDADR
jgi:UDP-N-acetylglucosamine:LPS N-acetylglucosamine transferase